MTAPAPRPPLAVELTTREKTALWLAATGHSNSQIGRKLWIAEDTVKTHLRKAYRKLGVADRAHAVSECYLRGLFPPRPKTEPATHAPIRRTS